MSYRIRAAKGRCPSVEGCLPAAIQLFFVIHQTIQSGYHAELFCGWGLHSAFGQVQIEREALGERFPHAVRHDHVPLLGSGVLVGQDKAIFLELIECLA